MDYKTFIFDLDGTLLNTLDDLAASCNYALRVNGLPEHSINDVRQFVGNGVKKLVERAVPNGLDNPSFDSVYEKFRTHYLSHSQDKTAPYPGIMSLLQKLRDAGYHVAVVSNKFYAATENLCMHYFGDLVDVAVGENEAAGIKKKPSPDIVEEAFRQLETRYGAIDRGRAVYVGDSDVDIQTARNVNLPCISVLWGFRSKEFLLAHGATTFVETPMQILEVNKFPTAF